MAKGFDPGELLNQARRMKDQMAKAQEQLKERVVEGEAAGGMVKFFVNGANEVVGVKIKPDAVDPKDLSMLEDLIQVACNAAMSKAKKMADDEMAKITGGMGLGGLM
jgi:nucleoid-associated protein EbfC